MDAHEIRLKALEMARNDLRPNVDDTLAVARRYAAFITDADDRESAKRWLRILETANSGWIVSEDDRKKAVKRGKR